MTKENSRFIRHTILDKFNHDLQLEIDCIGWALRKIEVNKIPNDRLEGVIRAMIKDLEKGKDQAIGKIKILTTCGLRLKVFNGFYCYFCNKKWEYGCDFGICQSTPTSTPKI